VSPEIEVLSASVMPSLASDHLPVIAELELAGRLVGNAGRTRAVAAR